MCQLTEIFKRIDTFWQKLTIINMFWHLLTSFLCCKKSMLGIVNYCQYFAKNSHFPKIQIDNSWQFFQFFKQSNFLIKNVNSFTEGRFILFLFTFDQKFSKCGVNFFVKNFQLIEMDRFWPKISYYKLPVQALYLLCKSCPAHYLYVITFFISLEIKLYYVTI